MDGACSSAGRYRNIFPWFLPRYATYSRKSLFQLTVKYSTDRIIIESVCQSQNNFKREKFSRALGGKF